MKSYEVSARTIEEAISEGLEHLGASISDVTVDILEEGSKGLFGLFGSRPAKVRLTLKEEENVGELAHAIFEGTLDEPEPEEEKPVRAPKAEKPRPEKQKASKAPRAPRAETAPMAEDAPAAKGPDAVPADEPPAPAPLAEEAPAAEPAQASARAPHPARRQKPRAPKPDQAENDAAAQASAEKPARPRKPREPRAPKAEKAPAERLEPREIVPAEQADRATPAGRAQEYLQELTRLMGVPVSVAVATDEEGSVRVNMEGDTLGILIGRRGETLDALQYLTSLQVNKGQEDYTRVTLDTEGYRAKREEALVRLANWMANRCVKTGRKVVLEPMNPYERRILHSTLQNHELVTTHSEGEEPNRHVVITLLKQ